MPSFTKFFVVAGAAALVASLYIPLPGKTSDHQDSPLTLARPHAQISDKYLYPATDPKNVVFAPNVQPRIPAAESSTVAFDPGVPYHITIDSTADYRDRSVLQFNFELRRDAQGFTVGPR